MGIFQDLTADGTVGADGKAVGGAGLFNGFFNNDIVTVCVIDVRAVIFAADRTGELMVAVGDTGFRNNGLPVIVWKQRKGLLKRPSNRRSPVRPLFP